MSDQPPGYVRIFDTTLRDGEQSPGAAMTPTEKLEVARSLARLGVDVIEAGFPRPRRRRLPRRARDSRRDRSVRSTGAHRPIRPSSAGSRAHRPVDIDKAWDAVRVAARPRIHIFLATSDLHMKHKLRMTRAEVVARVTEMVSYARGLCNDVEFSAEDAARSDPAFLHEVLAAAIRAGATTMNIPDTVGYTTPDEIRGDDRRNPRQASPAPTASPSRSTATTTSGWPPRTRSPGCKRARARPEVTINGIGERAGNASLEELVMALAHARAALGLRTGIDTTQLLRTSRLVSFVHRDARAGQQGHRRRQRLRARDRHPPGRVLKHEWTYEIMTPRGVGCTQTRLVLGKHSGRARARARLAELGYSVRRARSTASSPASRRWPTAASRSPTPTSRRSSLDEARPRVFSLEGLQVGVRDGSEGDGDGAPSRRQTGIHVHASVGTGPVDALYKAIDALVGARGAARVLRARRDRGHRRAGRGDRAHPPLAERTRERAATMGGTRVFHGHGADTDILVAAAKAYLAAINRMLAARATLSPARASGATTRVREAVGRERHDDALDRIFEKVWRVARARGGGGARRPLRRPAPRPRGHLAAGVLRAPGARPARAPPRSHLRHDGPLHAHAPAASPRRGVDCASTNAAAAAGPRENCAEFGIPLYGLGSPTQGIVHVIGPELGLTQPG